MKPLAALILTALALTPAIAQGGPVHILFGDFEVLEEDKDALRPKTFRILLKRVGGTILRQQTVGVRGRYRFMDVPNGDYILTVEAENRHMVEIWWRIDELKATDIRRDLELVWDDETDEPAPTPVVPVRYARAEGEQSLFEEAQAWIETGEHGMAATTLRKIVDRDPGDFEAWTELATVRFRAGEWDEAHQHYDRALELSPHYLPAVLNLGKLHLVLEEHREAVGLLSQARLLAPERAEIYYYLGEAHLQIQKGSQAVEFFNKSLELDPEGMADAHLRMAGLYHAAGYPARAAEEYDRYLSKRPQSPQRSQLEEYIRLHGKP